MKRINISIEGESPLLMNSPKQMLENISMGTKGKTIIRDNSTPSIEESAEKSAYWLDKPITKGLKKELYIPSEAIFRSMINASSFHKIGKKSAKSIIAGSMRVEPIEIPLGTGSYSVDIRTVVIQRNRIIKGRARLDKWKANFDIVYNDDIIGDNKILYAILKEAGERIGILDFRPQKGGQFGTFKITNWKVK